MFFLRKNNTSFNFLIRHQFIRKKNVFIRPKHNNSNNKFTDKESQHIFKISIK